MDFICQLCGEKGFRKNDLLCIFCDLKMTADEMGDTAKALVEQAKDAREGIAAIREAVDPEGAARARLRATMAPGEVA